MISKNLGRRREATRGQRSLSNEHGSGGMSRHLPAISGQELIRALRRAGFVVLRQKGSHVSLEKRTAAGYWRTIVPMHREIRPAR